MHWQKVLAASPSSLGSRFDRNAKLSPSLFGTSLEEHGSRRSSTDFAGNNAVSFSSTKSSPFRETASSGVKPTFGFAKVPLEETPSIALEKVNNTTWLQPTGPGLLSLTLKEDNLPLISRPLVERAISLDEESEEWDLEALQREYEVFSKPVVVEAYELAEWAFAEQKRKSGEPVLSHCVETAKILADLNADDHIVAAALLHDVFDDTNLGPSEIEPRASPAVIDLVKKVSKLSHISQLFRGAVSSDEDCEKLKDVLIASVDCRAVLIKLADRIHNMRTVNVLPLEKQTMWANETMQIFVPLAGRLGCWAIKSELEDLCFAILHPEKYDELKEKYDRKVEFNEGRLQGALDELQQSLDAAGIKCEDITGRPKNLYGVFKKMQKRGYSSIDDVLDLFALRIVVNEGESCHDVLKVVHDLWSTVPNKLKDYVTFPKPNGYKSIHDVCLVDKMPIEVQIRTTKMHYLAEHGVAAHWKYKEDNGAAFNEFVEQRTIWSRYVLNWVFELNDKKIRPQSSPSDVARSIWSAFWSFEEINRRTVPCQHGKGSETSWSPMHVVVKEDKGIQVCDAPANSTVQEFLLDHCEVAAGNEIMPVVNGEVVAANYVLQFGDLVEFGKAAPELSSIVPFERDLALP